MRVFVTGATGFIGSAVVKELLQAGHQVTGLARSDVAAETLKSFGARVHRGSIEDVDCLKRAAADADGAIHTAYFHEFTHASLSTRLRVIFGGNPTGLVKRFIAASTAIDRQAIDTIGRSLSGTDRPLVVACATMSMKAGQLAKETDAPDSGAVGAPRIGSERTALALAEKGVRASVIRLPPVVHGDNDRGGFLPRLIAVARKRGESCYVGDGQNLWPAVHVLDTANLFRLALERGSAGAKYHAIAEQGLPTKTIAEVIGRRLNVPIKSKSPDEAAKLFSWLSIFLPVDNPATGVLTQEQLGWQPTRSGMISDLDNGCYFKE